MRLSTISLMIAGFFALIMFSASTQAYHEYSWYTYNTGSTYGAGGYPTYTSSTRYVPQISTSYARTGYTDSRYCGGVFLSSGYSKYDSRYRGGFFPAFYEPSRPYGYQANTFNTGSYYDKTFHSRSMSWYYGTGKPDYFYDGYYARPSRYYQYN
ncbi:MAG: hypothetical protein ABIJ21_06775 [Nanoarchaeota archaeon]